jgi:GDP-L-fucose synthase
MGLNKETIFVAGATGTAGSAIVTRLLSDYPSIRIKASAFTTKPNIIDRRLEWVQGDLRSYADCRKLVRGCGQGILCAAITAGAKALAEAPWEQVNDNVAINANLLSAMHEEKVERAVFFSTVSVYQEFDGFIREDQLDLNTEPYSAYKGVGWANRYLEKLCAFWHETSGINVVVIRPSNIFGPFDKFDEKRSHFIPALIRRACAKTSPFEVWGAADVVRDVVFSDDVAVAAISALENADIKFDVFNVGSGVRTTIGQAVEWVLECSGHHPDKVVYVNDRPKTLRMRAVDCSKIGSALGWKPSISVKEGIRRTCEWWKQHERTWEK